MSQKELTDKEELLDLERKYEQILSNDPESNTFCLLADIQYKLGKIDKATGVLIKGLGYNKNNATARLLLGKIYYDRWLIDQAKKEMKKVLELSPDNLEAAKLLTQIHISENNFQKALSILEEANVFHRSDEETQKLINQIKERVSKIEGESSRHVFQTPRGKRKTNTINLEDAAANSEVVTETMLNLYIQQGQYDKARETIELLYKNEQEKAQAIEKLDKTKLNKMNLSAGFESRD